MPEQETILLHESAQNEISIEFERAWLYPKQEHAIFYPTDYRGEAARFSLVEASTKSGKTVSCIAWLFEQAITTGGKGKNYWWVAPVFGQADIAFRRMKLAFPAEVMTPNETRLTITLINGAVIWFKSAEKPDNLYGEDVYAAVIDEASRMREEAWHAVRSTLTATQGPARIIGNVKGKRNWFFNLARRAEQGAEGLSYHKIVSYDAVRAGVLVAEEVESAKRDLPEHVFKELYLAEPSDDGGNPFGQSYIEKCIAPLSSDPVCHWGLDLAKSVDWTVMIGLDRKGKTAAYERFQAPWETTIQRVLSAVEMRRAPCLVDSTGVGDPILERLQKDGGSTIFQGYKFTNESKQKLMEGLAVSIQKTEIGILDNEMKKELDMFEFNYRGGRVFYSAPEGYHDDTVCALALANASRAAGGGIGLWESLAA